MIKMHNGNNLVQPASSEITLNNGIKMQEQRGKKDMMLGKVIVGNQAGKEILYPLYAADIVTMQLENNTGTYHIVKDDDIIMSKE